MKLKTSFFTALLLYACDNNYTFVDEPVEDANNITPEAKYSYRVDMALVNKYMALTKKDKKLVSILPLIQRGDTLAFYAQFKEGWAVLPADKRLSPIMISSDEGAVDFSNTDNPVVQSIDGLMSYVKTKWNSNDTVLNATWQFLSPKESLASKQMARRTRRGGDYEGKWITYDTIYQDTTWNRDKLIKTRWGQVNPWYVYTPLENGAKTAVGCGPVAMAQLIYYLRANNNKGIAIPSSATYDSSGVPVFQSFSTANWDSIAWYENDTRDGVKAEASAAFMAYMGLVSMGIPSTSYSIDITPCFASDFAIAFSKYNVKYSELSGYNASRVFTEVFNNGSPVFMMAKQTSVSYGHTFLVDGAKLHKSSTTKLLRWDPTYVPTALELQTEDESLFFYDLSASATEPSKDGYEREVLVDYDETWWISMNWGWDGYSNNVYYNIYSNDNPESSGQYYSPYWAVGSYIFDYVYSMYYGFEDKN